MPRRDDGTAIRYEFQVFDTPKGRMIADQLEEIKADGGNVAAFIREALLFYIQTQAGNINTTGLGAVDHGFEATLPVQTAAISRPQVDDRDDETKLEIKTVSGGASAHNFLNSVLGLQQ